MTPDVLQHVPRLIENAENAAFLLGLWAASSVLFCVCRLFEKDYVSLYACLRESFYFYLFIFFYG